MSRRFKFAGIHRILLPIYPKICTESHYPTHKLEFLALKWAVVEKFHEYLYQSTFNMYTDNYPITFILSMAKLDAACQRWVASLANYNFQLYYQAGKIKY